MDILNEKIAGLVKKAEKSGMPYGILKKVYDRGMAAWKTGHRPGTTPQQWAFARVNSFVTKSSGTWGKADKDLANKVRGESLEEKLGFNGNYQRKSKFDGKEFDPRKELATLAKFRKALEQADKIHATLQYPYVVDTVTKIWDHLNNAWIGTLSYQDQIKNGKYDGVIDIDESVKQVADEDFTLPEACWDGYKQVGLKKKGNKMVPDCVPEDRDYKKEYDNYHSDPEQIKRRSKRNQARRSLEDSKQDIKGKDVHHKDNNPMNNDKSNLSVVSKNYNRKEPRLREKLLRQGILKNGKTRK